ncbi:hypothetical protein KPH14_006086 [Odynerus spinipes]|uniref:Protein AATF n=1 Tax=Odynerus spinipes TaxID=1348599 RepID=A0AAD9RJP3_9HYME|nr:hypothetical protein KPH14_006086 [Odynerus spinipes]
MASTKKKTVLAEKINSLLSAAPANIVSDDENEDTRAKLVERYEESDDSEDVTKSSKIRKQNVQLLDEFDKRYEGKKVSRKDIYEETDESNSDYDDDKETDKIDEEQDEDLSDKDEGEDEDEEGDEDDNEEEEQDEDEDSEDDSEQDVDRENPLYRERDKNRDANFRTMSSTNINEEREKGKSVQSQLKLWESLLEMRIRLQKCLVVGNRMPQYDTHKEFRKEVDFMKKSNETKSKLTGLLDSMLNLQATLWKRYPETKSLNVNKKKKGGGEGDQEDTGVEDPMDEEIPSDSEEEEHHEKSDDNAEDSNESDAEKNDEPSKKKLKFSEYEKILDERHKSYTTYRNTVISKWNDKTRVTTGKVTKSGNETTLKQIEFALNDKAKSRKRTQLKRSEYEIIGKSCTTEDDDGRRIQEYDPEIYDDDDFYHQLLRDLIEYKSSDITDPIQLSKQWIQLQSIRSKMKRKIDTRATKGRRVRYNVHNKLVNYMAPITVNDTWTDVAKTELYSSLFGKIKPVEAIEH